ncbi:MAG: CoA-binding protein, partial [Desulfatiglandales bacterium]
MLGDMKESPLYKIANPNSIAVFGASSDPSSMGSIQLAALMDLGFKGKIYPVHPRDKVIMGLKAYKNIAEVPERPDLALIVVPTRIVKEILSSCGEAGVRHAIVVSGGFKEMGKEGALLEEEVKETAKRYGIRFLGPNCIGVANPHAKLNTTVFRYGAEAGSLGMASQSGSFVTQMFDYLHIFNMGFSTAFSVGNEADIDIVDCLEYLALCPNTKVIALYIEGIKRGRRFLEVAREVSLRKPIVAYYVGGTETGKRAGIGHTGAMAGPEILYDSAFRQSGVVKANSVTELFHICWAFQNLPLPPGKRVVVQT